MNTMEEIMARDAPLFIITSLDLPVDRSNVHLIKIPCNKNFQILLMIVTDTIICLLFSDCKR